MKKIFVLFFTFLLKTSFINAQQFDITTYKPPEGWITVSKADAITFSKEDKPKGTWCIISVFKSLDASTDAAVNFNHSWNALVKENLGAGAAPQMQPDAAEKGWTAKTGFAPFEKDALKGVAMLVASSGRGKLVNILILTNSDVYQKDVTAFLASVDFKVPSTNAVLSPSAVLSTALKSKFKFNTTNFDDGWTAVEQADWVLVTKGNIKVYLHYKNEAIKPVNTDPGKMCAAAWDVLVAPRYKNMQQYKSAPNMLASTRPYFAKAVLTELSSGKNVFVGLFSRGNIGWIEIVCPDEQTFINNFGVDISKLNYYSDVAIFDPLQKLATYNKFAVAQSDLSGKWTSSFGGNTYYTNIYTGLSAGMSTYTSNEEYNFLSAYTYKWRIIAGNSYGGATKLAQGTGEGTFKMLNDWEVNFSNIEGKSKTYATRFVCVKGGRMLIINNTALIPGGN